MYGLWLYKELKTEYGHCKVEVYRKGYTASAVEIGGFVGNSLNLALENLDTITAPIGKSVCSFSIYDTDQVEYDDLFTPDATAYKVVVSTKMDGGAYVTRWSGYITPDFFAENLSYRTPINISARDNIGYLNDVDFDLDASTITVRELIVAAFNRIAEDYPMQIVFATQKQTSEGIFAIDATISTYLLREKSWYEALETVLHDLGLQMRWVDNNTIAVLDISQLGENFGLQGFNFIESSGYREILPAWRELAQEQSYGVLDNFYKGQIDAENRLEYAANSAINTNILLYQPKTITQWSRQGEVYFLNFYNSYNAEIDDNKQDSIFITGIAPTVTNAEVLEKKMVYSQAVTEVDKQIKMTFNLNDTLRTPLASQYSRGERNTLYLPYSQSSGTTMLKTPRPYQLKFRFNIFLRANDGTNYLMREDWVEESALSEQPFIEFLTDKLQIVDTGVTDGQGNHRFAYTGYNNSKEYSITIGSIPKAGTLEFVVYPWTFEKDDYSSARDTATYQRGAKISDIVFSVQVGKTGVETKTQVGVLHNIAEKANYSFGQVPQREGDIITYAGGLFKSDTITALQGFKRNVDGPTYPLLELVGREIIHFNKRNYTKLSGTVKNLSNEPLGFNKLLVYNGKNYLPFACSLDVISNTMNVTTMQEVEPYMTHSFVEIKSELVTGGGATISGGNNTALQYSAEVGNAKRISELNNASESEKKEAYIVVDNASWGESKKVPLNEMEGLNEAELTEFLTANEYATQPWVSGIAKGLADDIANRVLIADFEKLEDAVDGIAGYFTNGLANNALKLGGQLPSYYATVDALNLVKNDITAVSNRVQKFEDVIGIDSNGDVYIKGTRNFYTAGGTIGMAGLGSGGSGGGTAGLGSVTVRVNGQDYITDASGIVTIPNYPSLAGYATEDYVTSRGYITNAALNGYAKLTDIPTSLPASDVYTWAKAATKPTYTASEVGALSVNGGILNGNININTTTPQTVYSVNNDDVAIVGYRGGIGAWLYNDISGSYLSIADDGAPIYNGYTLYHTGNFNPANYLPLSGGIVSNSSRDVLALNSTDSYGPMLNLCVNGAKVSAIGHIPSASESIYGMFISNTDSNIGLLLGSDRKVYITENVESLSKTYTVIHSGNYNSYALPLSGGTINSDSYVPLTLNANSNQSRMQFQIQGVDKALVGWSSSEGAWLYSYPGGSYLHIKDDGTPCYNGNTLFHSGNANRADVSWAASNILFPQGTSATWNVHTTGAYKGITILNTVGEESEGAPISYAVGLSVSGYYGFTLAHYGGEALYWLKGSGNADWYAIIHSGNIGSHNAGSATKLQTARTIWGQSFDGSANVSGVLSDVNQVTFDANKSYGIFRGDWYNSSLVREDLAFYAPKSVFSGNVLIGKTSDNGCKLQVKGAISSYGSVSDLGGYAYYWGMSDQYFLGSNGDADFYMFSSSASHLRIGTNNIERARITSGGNVLLGTTTDWGFNFAVSAICSDKTSGILGQGGGAFFGNIAEGYGTAIWTQGNGNGYIQQGRSNGAAVNYNLVMQHLGGNVLIGTTDDNTAKLQVDGNMSLTSALIMKFYGNATCGLYPNNWISNDGVNNRLWLCNDNQLALYGSEIQLRNTTKVHGDLTVYRPGSTENLLIYVRDTQVAYQGYDSDGYVYHDFLSNDTHIARFDGYSNCLTVYNFINTQTIYTTNWVRSYNATGWFNETYGGGIYMTDANYVRVYNGKGFQVDGNVLVGTATDNGAKLKVGGGIHISRENIYGEYDEGIRIEGASSDWCGVFLGTSSERKGYQDSQWYLLKTSSNTLRIGRGISSTSYLEVQNNGNIGIGTTVDSGYKLDVAGNARLMSVVTEFNDEINRYGGSLYLQHRGSIAGSQGDARTNGVIMCANGGYVGIGTANPTERLTVSGNTMIFGNLTATGDITSEGTIAMARLTSSSDAKLKDNIKWLSADRAMRVVRALKPTEWDWKKDNTHSFGFIAQDVQPIIPEMVSCINDTLRLEYNQLHAFEIGAIQHIDSEVEQLKIDLKAANEKIEQLESKLKQYELWQ